MAFESYRWAVEILEDGIVYVGLFQDYAGALRYCLEHPHEDTTIVDPDGNKLKVV